MKKQDVIQKFNEAMQEIDRDEYILGVRLENKVREVGEQITECSKDNPDRDDDREFPQYGTPEYNELPDLDGISTWDADDWLSSLGFGENIYFEGDHAYLLGCTEYVNGPDGDEFIMKNAIVLGQLF